MRPLVVSTFLTLDGVLQAPGGPQEDPTGGFKHGGWMFPYWDEAMGKRMDVSFRRPFDLLLGRRTYEIFAAHWPYAPETPEDPAPRALNSAKKYVASKTLKHVGWNNSTLLTGDAAEAVATLKAESGPEILVFGSANLLQTLIKHDLVDRFQLWLFPLVVGPGKRLFADGTMPKGLKLVESETSSTGVVMATYEKAGEVNVGSFAAHQPSAEELERRRKLAKE